MDASVSVSLHVCAETSIEVNDLKTATTEKPFATIDFGSRASVFVDIDDVERLRDKLDQWLEAHSDYESGRMLDDVYVPV